jgi:lipoprotein-anchoring transpeptidase ErfK/SrfK
MKRYTSRTGMLLCLASLTVLLSSCSTHGSYNGSASSRTYSGYEVSQNANYHWNQYTDYSERIPQTMNTKGKRVVVIDPKTHTWGAYDANGQLVRAGIATAGGNWCPDINRPCHTGVGSFTVKSLGPYECKSSKYPLPRGGGLMPYCMFFNNDQALHGSPDGAVVEDNISHGCVRVRIADAEWLRYNFVNVGTKVVVQPY